MTRDDFRSDLPVSRGQWRAIAEALVRFQGEPIPTTRMDATELLVRLRNHHAANGHQAAPAPPRRTSVTNSTTCGEPSTNGRADAKDTAATRPAIAAGAAGSSSPARPRRARIADSCTAASFTRRTHAGDHA